MMQLIALPAPPDPDECALLEFQRRWFYDRSLIKVAAKSRQVGITWTTAAEAVEVAATRRDEGGLDVYFMTTSRDDARAFILDCAQWVAWFTPTVDGLAEEAEVLESEDWFTDDNGSAILAFRIDFPSGCSIFALPTRPARMRGKKHCFAILDEAAQADVDEWLTAAGGALMWRGRLAVISTYYGTDNHFYKLVQRIKTEEMDASLHEIDIYDALRDGLYKRICRVNRTPWSAEAETAYVEWLRKTVYPGRRFAQECECIPEQGGGQHIPPEVVERCLTIGPDKCTIFEVKGGARPTVWVNNDERDHSTSWEGKDGANFEQRLDTMRQWLERYVAPVLARINSEGLSVYAGLDYGRTTNMSSFILGVLHRSRVREARLVIELENVPWPEQALVQDFMWAGLRNLKGGAADKGGNGGPEAERTEAKTRGVVKAVNILSGWHNPHFTVLEKRLLEQSWLLPLHFGPLAGDITSLRRVKGKIVAPQRTTITGRKQKRHADGAFGLALCEQSIGADGPAMLTQQPPRKVRRIKRTRR